MKQCSKCKTQKSLSEFYKDRTKKDGHNSYCKECNNSYYKNWSSLSEERKKRHSDWKQRKRGESRVALVEYFSGHPCTDCGETDIRVLEFDHVRGKTRNVGPMISNGVKWETVLKEIEKCDVRCANCHRIKTSERGNFWTTAL